MEIPFPKNESERVETLLRYGILDTPSDPVIDSITQAAADLIHAPIALVSLIDQTRSWFKSSVGLSIREAPRQDTICTHTILQPGVLLEVHDLTQDPRFSENAWVNTSPGIRFYAGLPLVTAENVPLGTLCILDYEPRRLTAAQKDSLYRFSDLIMKIFEKQKNAMTNAINEAIDKALQHGIIVTNANPTTDYRIVYCNPAFERLTGYSQAEIQGRNCRFLQGDETNEKDRATLQNAITAQWQNKSVTLKNYRKDGSEFWNEITVSPIKDTQGNTTHYVGIQTDVTERYLLKQRSTQLEAALELMEDEVYIFDDESLNFIHANQAARKNLGYSMTELTNLTPVEIKPGFTREALHTRVRPLLEDTQKDLTCFAHLVRKDKSIYPVQATIRHTSVQSESVFVASIQDISNRLRTTKPSN